MCEFPITADEIHAKGVCTGPHGLKGGALYAGNAHRPHLLDRKQTSPLNIIELPENENNNNNNKAFPLQERC